jgi:hypothetical protein
VKKNLILTLVVLICSCAGSVYAQSSAAASPTMTLTIPQVASISISNFTIGTSSNPGNFASTLQGTATLNYSVRVPKTGSPNAKITVQSASTSATPGTSASTAPAVSSFEYSASGSGTGVTPTSSWQGLSGTTAGTVMTFASGTKIDAGTATLNFRIADSPTFDADTFTLPLTFTISSQ